MLITSINLNSKPSINNLNSKPSILKVKKITGKYLVFTDANIVDAEFILKMRTNTIKSQHISSVEDDLDKQRLWLSNYATNNSEAYFIINSNLGERLGTVRIYDAKDSSFCWGSWILKDGAPYSASIESALIVYSYAIDHLGFTSAHFDVRKSNISVWRFHERFGALRTDVTDRSYSYSIDLKTIKIAQEKYKKFLTENVKIED